jgi:hypothetical protein
VTEIRSFRRVFDLERRIYTIDKLRLNPAGVPVRGIAYALALLAAILLFSRSPVIGSLLRVPPWYLRELAFPAGAATVLATIRVDGRTFHLAARAHLRLLTAPRSVSGLSRPSAVGVRWRAPDLLFLPDGSDHRLRALRYHGPGAVLVRAPHERAGAVERRGVGVAARPLLRLWPAPASDRQECRRVISLEPGATLLVAPGPSDRPRSA